MNKKKCKKCQQCFEEQNFYKIGLNLSLLCKPCYKERRKKYYLNNKEAEITRNKKWKEKNKEKYREWVALYARDKYKNNEIFRTYKNIDSSIRKSLKTKTSRRNKVSNLKLALGIDPNIFQQAVLVAGNGKIPPLRSPSMKTMGNLFEVWANMEYKNWEIRNG